MNGAIMAQDRHNDAMGLKPIETRAYGHRFRSRLEAHWAVAFTEASIWWRYEPEGFDLGEAGLYLPDFWLPQVSMWAEVKPDRPTHGELRKVAALANSSGHSCLLLIGPPAAVAYWAVTPHDNPDAWEISCGGILAGSVDCSPFAFSYHLAEGRFYENCGVGSDSFPMPIHWGSQGDKAVDAALSARFEHGESPR